MRKYIRIPLLVLFHFMLYVLSGSAVLATAGVHVLRRGLHVLPGGVQMSPGEGVSCYLLHKPQNPQPFNKATSPAYDSFLV